MADKPNVPTSRLVEVTRELLQKRPRSTTYTMIEAATGLSTAWLTDFISDRDRDFGVNKVEHLYTYLTGEKLDV